jgi:hypothetical protein
MTIMLDLRMARGQDPGDSSAGGCPLQDRAVARLPAGVESQRDDAPAAVEATEDEPVGAADHPGTARIAVEHVRSDDVHGEPPLVVLDLDQGNAEEVLVGVESREHAPPLGGQGRTRDVVGLAAEQRRSTRDRS